MGRPQRADIRVMRGLLDLVVLQLLNAHPMHGPQVIAQIMKNFGINLGPSAVYPILSALETNHAITSTWSMNDGCPRKKYQLTSKGKKILSFSEKSLHKICKKLTASIQAGSNLGSAARKVK